MPTHRSPFTRSLDGYVLLRSIKNNISIDLDTGHISQLGFLPRHAGSLENLVENFNNYGSPALPSTTSLKGTEPPRRS